MLQVISLYRSSRESSKPQLLLMVPLVLLLVDVEVVALLVEIVAVTALLDSGVKVCCDGVLKMLKGSSVDAALVLPVDDSWLVVVAAEDSRVQGHDQAVAVAVLLSTNKVLRDFNVYKVPC